MSEDRRRFSPAVARNRGPLLEALRPELPGAGTLLEIASGSGEHAVALARALPGLRVQPSDPDVAARDSIEAWRAWAGLPNLCPPLDLDVQRRPWPSHGAPELVAILCVNMLHIAPWSACLALFDGAAESLAAGAPLLLYGPFREGGRHTAPSNQRFDESLRLRDPAWGVRDLEAIAEEGAARGLPVEQVVPMPANNRVVVLRRA